MVEIFGWQQLATLYYAIGKAFEDTPLCLRDTESFCSAASKYPVRVKEDQGKKHAITTVFVLR